MTLQDLLNVNTVFFTALDYPMSYVEFFGTIFTGWSVYLAAKNKISNWPIGIVGIILFGILFYQIQLYSDLMEQVYYLATGFWGWWLWSHPNNSNKSSNSDELKISYSSSRSNLIAVAVIAVLSVVMTKFMSNIHLIFPTLFPVAASFPLLDAFTTVLSFVATIYLVRRRIESWYLWIVVDVIAIWLYYTKGVVFISILYFAFLLNAIRGYVEWVRIYKNNG